MVVVKAVVEAVVAVAGVVVAEVVVVDVVVAPYTQSGCQLIVEQHAADVANVASHDFFTPPHPAAEPTGQSRTHLL